MKTVISWRILIPLCEYWYSKNHPDLEIPVNVSYDGSSYY